jgi:deoxyribonuclease I
MKLFSLLFLIVSSSVFAQEDQKLPGNKWAYYGEEFYAILASGKKFERPLFSKILNGTHSSQKGKFDSISPDCKGSCYNHTSVGYDRARKIMFGELDKREDAKGTYVLDVYCGRKFYFKNVEDISSMGSIVNIEHTWPQSKFTGKYPKDMQKSDMHHLYPTDSHANSTRGNTPFGFISFLDNRYGENGCGKSFIGFDGNNEVYTPPVSHRGNVARALFYFSMHYDIGISKSEEMVLREWHKADPIDQTEIKRHEGIAKYQKVRNPFVDHPELVERISDF